MSGVLVVGQAPSRATDGRPPFSGRSGIRLARLLDVPHGQLTRKVDLANLLARWLGKDGKGDAFPMGEARAAATMLLAVAPHDRLVLCGGLVCRAFGLAALAPLGRLMVGRRLVLHLPHPSGVNRWWNAPDHEADAPAALRFLLAADPWAA